MTARGDLLYSTYSHFTDDVMNAIRKETFGVDIGQNSWLTIDEYRRFVRWLALAPTDHVLEIACGAGGPALCLARMIGCRVTGIDANERGVAAAARMAAKAGEPGTLRFSVADANTTLPFEDGSFDALLCIDSMNHLPDRLGALREWRRVLRPGGRALFTDPVVVTGPVTGDELARRSSIGPFLFVPPGTNERMIAQAGFQLVRRKDVTDNAARVAGRWYRSRLAHRDDLLPIEGEERFEGLQQFFATVHRLTSERRLSRVAYLAVKRSA
jgi:SAM-dependent methyltransferase